MKKIYLFVVIIILLTGCNKKEKKIQEKIILSTGTLECVLKENRTYNNSLYTSYYIFNYNKNGVLETVENREILDVKKVEKKEKENYKSSYLKTIEDTKKIDGVTLEDLSKENIYEIKIIYNLSKMNKKDIEDYGFDLDRKLTYILYEKERYICE